MIGACKFFKTADSSPVQLQVIGAEAQHGKSDKPSPRGIQKKFFVHISSREIVKNLKPALLHHIKITMRAILGLHGNLLDVSLITAVGSQILQAFSWWCRPSDSRKGD